MVKKYPFSSKTVKAMIAATIAFTPLAATAVSLNASSVEAALKTQADWHFDSTSNLAAYSQAIHAQISLQEDVIEVKKALDSLTAQQWIEIVTPILEPTANSSEVAAAAVLVETYIHMYLNSITTTAIDDFISTTSNNFKSAQSADYLQYLENAEEKLYAEYVAQTTDSVNDPAFDLFKSAVESLKAAQDPSGKIQPKIQSTFNLSNDAKVQQAGGLLVGYLIADPNSNVTQTNLKSAGLKAATAWNSLYDQAQPSTGGGGGGGPVTPPGDVITQPGGDVVITPVLVQNGTQVTATIPNALQTQILANISAQTDEITIQLPAAQPGQTVSLDIPAPLVDAVEAKAPNATIIVLGDGATYYLPVAEIDTATIAKDLGTTVADLKFRVSINPIPSDRAIQITQLLKSRGANVVASIVDITLEAVVGDTVHPIKSLGNVYVERAFGLNKNVNKNRATGAVLENDGTYRALPTKFKTVNGQQRAIVSSLTNSIYTVVESDITFPDVNGGKNWAEDYIETLASKYIISGSTAGTYKPDEYMTRAQFALLLSRSLGLPSVPYDKRFKDVKGDEWFNVNGALMAAVKTGIVAGKADGTFAPNDRITRAEAAAMIGRALNLDSINFDSSKLNTSKKLADFKDAKSIGASTRADVLKVYQAGIMAGASNGTFQPNEFTKRDQMARILAEFLIKANLMDDIK